MNTLKKISAFPLISSVLILALLGCASVRGPYTTDRDKTKKGAGIGAAAGALAAIIDGKREADEILAGAAIGAVVGGSIGAYMDAQEEKLARIPGTTVERVDEKTLLVKFDSDVLFAVNAASLNQSSQSALIQTATVLQEYNKTAVIVQGHTDSTGSTEHNQGLSERRAASVKTFLGSEGIAQERMAAVGYGESKPVASNDTQAGRQQNRRVDVLLRAKAR